VPICSLLSFLLVDNCLEDAYVTAATLVSSFFLTAGASGAQEWEDEFLNYLSEYNHDDDPMRLFDISYSAERSLVDEVLEVQSGAYAGILVAW
jgi:hypothetical protein